MTNVESEKPARGQRYLENISNFVGERLPKFESKISAPLYRTTGVWYLDIYKKNPEEYVVIQYFARERVYGFTHILDLNEVGLGMGPDETYKHMSELKKRLLDLTTSR